MRILFIPLIGLITTTMNLAAQDTAALLRPAFTLKVAVDKNHFTARKSNPGPIYCRTTRFSSTMTVTFSQLVRESVHIMTILKVTNPFGLPLVYKASIFLLSWKKWVATDVYPVEPGIAGYETWQDIIISVGLGDWALQKSPS